MEDNINKQLLDDLKNLPKVSAPADFEEELWKKIYSKPEKKITFLQKIFSVNKFIPATATLAVLIIIFFLLNNNSSDYEDPFMIEPPVRTDIITVSNEDSEVTNMIEQKQKAEQQEWKSTQLSRQSTKENSIVQELDSSSKDKTEMPTSASQAPAVINDQVENVIDKEELNFLKKTVSEQEKQEILELKKKIKTYDTQKTE
ncbi:Hypothetical protein IALB_0378 [Ignavibacterium album JCM 16511]|uniref:Uncharacterized protein n=1 Tax=Ignavibacterium album (strain DSM 19864 / JCM 16511 / NBRC 101810 / Mat9-16) TaxID=945713 RepID=I0AGI3_IGNAJ|nr:hypothetical protein [Ignavibacterium album]AFH48090.1 Hypothetical protein IALB_0378 [Ignavibacterium album JCM 16511]